jgi:hypothetical protein
MKTLYKFFKTAEVSQQIIIHQKVKVEKYNLTNIQYKYSIQAPLLQLKNIFKIVSYLINIIKDTFHSLTQASCYN